MRIALDAMGGDYAPASVVEGAVLASRLNSSQEIVLVGKKDKIEDELRKLSEPTNLFEIVHAEDVIEMGEHPTKAIPSKPESSIVKGFGLLAHKKVDAFCSAGNTGAMLVGAMYSVKVIEGILRPCIAGFFPKISNDYGILLDIGANSDCKPEFLDQFALIGSLYAENVLHIKNPRVGLINIGEEEQKGSVLTQAAHQMMKANTSINFAGNLEGRDILTNKADVLVCDGFTGNVVLKLAESFYDIFKNSNINSPFFNLFNYHKVGGSPILGVDGNVIIGHGVSTPEAIKNMISIASGMVLNKITEKIKISLQHSAIK